MGIVNPVVDPSHITQALVFTLLHVFDETRDLIYTLRSRERREHEEYVRAKGYSASRHVEYIDNKGASSDEVVVMDKAAVTRQYEIGYQEIGAQFAIGDVTSHTALQSQIITLQGMLIATFLYGPTSTETIASQLSNLSAASRAAGTTCVDILGAQLQRQKPEQPQAPRSSQPPKTAPDHSHSSSTTSTSLVRYQGTSPRALRSGSPANTTVLEWRGQPKLDRTDTDTTSITGPTSYGMKSIPHDLYCLYAIDLQKHPTQPLSSSITSDPAPYCPHCKRTLHLSPGKAWELRKEDDGFERIFQISNRFVVKCHRDGVDGQYSCIICSKHADIISVCGDVKALIRHIWEEHSIAQLKHEEDITELFDLPVDRRRDSGIGYPPPRSSRRSVSVGPSRRRSRHEYGR